MENSVENVSQDVPCNIPSDVLIKVRELSDVYSLSGGLQPEIKVPHGTRGILVETFKCTYPTVHHALIGDVGRSLLRQCIRVKALELGGVIFKN